MVETHVHCAPNRATRAHHYDALFLIFKYPQTDIFSAFFELLMDKQTDISQLVRYFTGGQYLQTGPRQGKFWTEKTNKTGSRNFQIIFRSSTITRKGFFYKFLYGWLGGGLISGSGKFIWHLYWISTYLEVWRS